MGRLYFGWLYDRVVREPRESPLGYVYVCNLMHQIKFDDRTPNDDNRSADGRELRRLFLIESQFQEDQYTEWLAEPATIFEVIVGLCLRADFQTELGDPWWFKQFMIHLNIDQYYNSVFTDRDSLKIEKILKRFNERTYSQNGHGGLFPLKHTARDQRGVELWYQMAEFLRENRLF